jgi:chemotaxis protein CheX
MKALPPVDLPKICQWMETAVSEVVDTMFGAAAYADGTPDLASWSGTFIQSEISFSGGLNLKMRIWMGEESAAELTSRALQMPKQELSETVVGDTVGELSNMILGAVKSKVADRGYPCQLSIPSVSRGVPVAGFGGLAENERFLHFRFGSGRLLLNAAIA